MATATEIQQKFAQLAQRLSRGAVLKVGFFEGAKYPDGTSVAMVAAIQEFGAPGAPLGPIPPRPYFRTMIRTESPGWSETFGRALVKYDYDVDRAMQAMGLVLQGQLKKSIADLTQPALSEVSLMLRKWRNKDPNLRVGKRTVLRAIAAVKAGQRSGLSGTAAKPLTYSGRLLASVDFEVTDA